MARTYTAQELITSVRNLLMLGSSADLGSEDAELLIHINELIYEDILPSIHRAQEDYNLASEQVTIVGGTTRYRMPTRAMWGKLKHVRRVDTSSGTRSPLTPAYDKETDEYGSDARDYEIEGNDIVLLNDNTTGTIEFKFYFRPGELVLSTAARQVLTVNTSTGAITFSSAIPTSWTTSNLFDVHSKNSGADIKVWDATASVASSTNMTLSSTIDGTVAGTRPIVIGDWVCLAEEAAVPGVPRELHSLIVRGAAGRWCESIGYQNEAKLHYEAYSSLLKKTLRSMERRIETKPLKIKAYRGILHAGRR